MKLEPLSVLFVEDSEDDMLLLLRALRRGGYEVYYERADTSLVMEQVLRQRTWDIVIADYCLPHFSGREALKQLQGSKLDVPFILVSGAIGENAAVAMMKSGVHDYIPKGDLSRLIPAVRRALAETTERQQGRKAQELLYASQRMVSSTLDSLSTHIAILDKEGSVLYTNRAWQQFVDKNYHLKKSDMLGVNYLSFCSHTHNKEANIWSKKIIAGVKSVISGSCKEFVLEYPLLTVAQDCWLKMQVTQFVGDGPVQVVLAQEEITERKKMNERLAYLNIHDSLTGLYNRAYFETAFTQLSSANYSSVGIITCDINGLKLVNNTLGDEVGDVLLLLAADFIRESVPETAIVARTGGDEFTVLVPNTEGEEMKIAFSRITQAIADYNTRRIKRSKGLHLNMSIGYAVGGGSYKELTRCLKEADDNMYREKLHSSQSARSAIVNTVMKLLEARDFLTEGHAERMQNIVAALGQSVGLPENKIADLRLLAQFHDIGKVGIPDRILFKPGPLTTEEFDIMKKHCDIGCRIAQAAPDLSTIAEQILKHHEWWSGEGYPLGLKGKDIPLECRILSIADAYDAMTSDRPYRKALSHEQAIAEIKRFSGIQFDAELVEAFNNINLK